MKHIWLFERSWRRESASHSTPSNWPQWFDDIQVWWLCWPEKVLSASSCLSKQDWTILAVCLDDLSSWKTASLNWKNIWTIGSTWLPIMFTYSLASIRPLRVIIGPAKYEDIAVKSSQIHTLFHSLNKTFRIIGFLRRSPNINPAWFWKLREGRLI
jgi:hypothetical protein